jgi:ABC-type Zn uptake system ZnuABC Zn-binding protein ZnuA
MRTLCAILVVAPMLLGLGCEPSAPTPTPSRPAEAPAAQSPTGAQVATPQPLAKPAASTQAPSAGVQPPAPAAPGSPKLKVVATFSVLGDLVRAVGGERIDLRVLVGPESDAHTFDPSPADTIALAEAALVVENGLGFEPWLDRLYAASRSPAKRVVATAGLTDLIHTKGHDDHGDRPGQEAHDDVDPHVWHDVRQGGHMVGVIRDALVQADPANAATYRANAERYLAELQALDAWIVERVATLPAARRKLVTAHDTFAYFARRYGFTIVGTALGAATTEVADPSAAQIAALVREIKAAGVPAIFAENVRNPRLMERIASEAGVQLVTGLYTDALGRPGSPGDSYVKMLRSNVERIVAALSR